MGLLEADVCARLRWTAFGDDFVARSPVDLDADFFRGSELMVSAWVPEATGLNGLNISWAAGTGSTAGDAMSLGLGFGVGGGQFSDIGNLLR